MKAYVRVMRMSEFKYVDHMYPIDSHERDELILGMVYHDQDWCIGEYEDQIR